MLVGDWKPCDVRIPFMEMWYLRTSRLTLHLQRKAPVWWTTSGHFGLKRKNNWRKLLLLGIQTGDKLAKLLFFIAYSRLCRHCRNLAEGGCLLSRFHFTTFWVISLVGIYPGRASIIDLHRIRYILHRIMYSLFATSNWHEIWRHYDVLVLN